jgi:hypothetical protein
MASGHVYTLPVNFPSYDLKTGSLYIDSRTFRTFFQFTTSTRLMMAGLAQGGPVSVVLLSLDDNDITARTRHFELVQYVDDSSHSHVPQSTASQQLPGGITRWTGVLSAGLCDCHESLEEDGCCHC